MVINFNSFIFVSQLKTKQLLVKEDRIRVKKIITTYTLGNKRLETIQQYIKHEKKISF